ncbi:hypothetical protein DERP_003456 [Dermatophagoides pteronyssinus]|uniref:Uncharacterized protein n=1 Tax=Dermatophagoides pteronyssinus TaxID=6956 RepID=A0ABQ8JKU5_DERPT|nr:hypothetical protein DERP_003456 [Dermatophagoides pteronyssinus]
MFHVRSYSVRLKKRNMETVSSFRRNLQRRRGGGGGGGANSGGGGGGDGLNDSFRSKTSSRRRSTSLTTTTTGSLLNEQQQQQQQQQCSSIKSPISSIDPQLQSKTINNEKETVTKIVKFNQPRQPPTTTTTTKKKSFDKSNDDYQSENSKERLTFRRISLQALSAEVSNVGAVSGESVQIGAGGEFDPNFFNRHRRLTSLYSSYGPEAAAILEAQKMASKRKPPGGQSGGGQLGGVGGSGGGIGGIGGSSGKGPSSLFIFSDDNFIRRHTRFIIEWPYPFHK